MIKRVLQRAAAASCTFTIMEMAQRLAILPMPTAAFPEYTCSTSKTSNCNSDVSSLSPFSPAFLRRAAAPSMPRRATPSPQYVAPARPQPPSNQPMAAVRPSFQVFFCYSATSLLPVAPENVNYSVHLLHNYLPHPNHEVLPRPHHARVHVRLGRVLR